MWITTKEAAETLNKSVRTIQRMVKTGKLQGKEVLGVGRGGVVKMVFVESSEKNEKTKDMKTNDTNLPKCEKKSSKINEKFENSEKKRGNNSVKKQHSTNDIFKNSQLPANKDSYKHSTMPTNDISEKRQNRQLSEMKQVTGNNKIAQGGVQHGVQLSDVSHNNMKLKDLIASFEWVPVDQGVQLTLVSRRTIFNKINKGQIAAIKIPDPTCGQRTFIKISDLSPLAEMKWHEIQTKRLSEHLPAVIKKEKKKFEMGSQHDRDIAWARLSIIKSFYKVQEIAKKEGKRKSEADKLFLHKLEDREILKEEMKLLDLDRLGLSTVKRWIKQYNDSGNINFPVSLLPSKKGKVGRKRIKATEIRARIRTLASEDVNLPATIIYRMLLAEFDLDEETCPLRPSTVYSDVRKIRSDIFIMAGRKGKESYKNMVKPHLHRLNDAEPGEIWESDGHRMNNACYNPFFYQEGYKPLIRPILVAWFDIATGMITSWALGANESFHLMVTSFRQGLQDFGAPKKVRVDNGSGYRNAYTDVEYFAFRKTKTKTNSKKTALELYQRGYRGFFQECGVEKVQFTIPGNSESKAIEPAWRYTLVEFEKTVSLFLGETAEKRPEKYRVSYKKLIKQFGDEILTWNEYVAALDRAINNYNNSKRKVLQSPSGELSPIEMYYQFPENINKLSIPEIEYQCRDMFPKPCTVSRGEIKIMGMYYRHPLLVDYLGRKVNVYYDERNLESVQVGTLDGEIWTTPAKRIIPSSQMNPEQFEKAIKANNHYQKEMITTYANIHNNAEDLSIEQKNEIADSSVEQLLLEQANTQERIKNNQHKMITSRFTIENIKNTELKTKDVETEPEEKTESPFLALSRKVKG